MLEDDGQIWQAERGWSASRNEVWLPGLYDSEAAARYALRLPRQVLQDLSGRICPVGGEDRNITLGDMDTIRVKVLSILHRKTGAATTPRNMAMWFGCPVDEVKAELAKLQAEGIAGPLPAGRGRERTWLLAEDL